MYGILKLFFGIIESFAWMLVKASLELLRIILPWVFKGIGAGTKAAVKKLNESSEQKYAQPKPVPPPPFPAQPVIKPLSPAPSVTSLKPKSSTATMVKEKYPYKALAEAENKPDPLFAIPPEDHKVYSTTGIDLWEKFDPAIAREREAIENEKLLDEMAQASAPQNPELPPASPQKITPFLSEDRFSIPPADGHLYTIFQNKLKRMAA